MDEVEVGHLLTELLLKLLDNETSQQLLSGETKDVSAGNRKQAVSL